MPWRQGESAEKFSMKTLLDIDVSRMEGMDDALGENEENNVKRSNQPKKEKKKRASKGGTSASTASTSSLSPLAITPLKR
mmetsp:Transcript_29190/g.57344  ORF Transcript_29190/g.57344 Transcript_29190/m.57344 type:complete len:80 (+) Transcript_29190:458-697(+)